MRQAIKQEDTMSEKLDRILENLGQQATEQMVIDEFDGKSEQTILDTLNEWFTEDDNSRLAEDIHDWLSADKREAEVELYEDSGGGLFLQMVGQGCHWGDLEYTNSNFAEDASCLTAIPGDTMDWTIPVYDGQLSHNPPNIEHVATYQGDRITWISDSIGRAAEQYLGRSVLSVADAAAIRHVAKITVNKWISDQGLPARKIGNQYVIRLSDLMAFEPAPAGWPSKK
jgi:excisionase family DNA binding protein